MKPLYFLVSFLFILGPAARADFKVLTFNAWILEDPIFGYSISKDTDYRVQKMPEQIAATGADLVFLQEVWSADKRDWLISEFEKRGYSFATFRNPSSASLRGRLGNGLLIISKFPLDGESQILSYSEYTRVEEFFAQKGAIKTRVRIPGVGWIDVYNTHLGAVTAEENEFSVSESAIKFRQTEELADFIAETATSDFAVLAADLNSHYFAYRQGRYCEEYTPEYSLLTCYGKEDTENSCLGFRDSYRDVHGFEKEPVWTFSNYHLNSGSNQIFKLEPKGVIDYIFSTPHARIVAKKSKVVFLEPLPPGANQTEPVYLSDHGGVLTTFMVK